MEISLDNVDLQILQLMQENARIPNVDMAKKLEMAPSAVLERVKKLEQKLVIQQYTTLINPLAIGQKLLSYVFVKTSQDSYSCQDAGNALSGIPEVQEVHTIAGEDCFLVKVRTTDSAALISLMRNEFARIPGIHSTKTVIVLETVKEGQKLVIPGVQNGMMQK